MNEPIRIYITMENTDQIEGKGAMVPRFIYFDPEAAVRAVKNKGPMGAYDADVAYLDLYRTGAAWKNKKPYYDGWKKQYVEKHNDPEWAEYERLRKKFGGAS